MEIVTANELVSGSVVWLAPDGSFVDDIDRARVFAAEEAAERDALVGKAQATGRIVGIEIEKVEVVDGRVVAHRLRERIRAEGPTAPRHARQELGEDGHVSL